MRRPKPIPFFPRWEVGTRPLSPETGLKKVIKFVSLSFASTVVKVCVEILLVGRGREIIWKRVGDLPDGADNKARGEERGKERARAHAATPLTPAPKYRDTFPRWSP